MTISRHSFELASFFENLSYCIVLNLSLPIRSLMNSSRGLVAIISYNIRSLISSFLESHFTDTVRGRITNASNDSFACCRLFIRWGRCTRKLTFTFNVFWRKKVHNSVGIFFWFSLSPLTLRGIIAIVRSSGCTDIELLLYPRMANPLSVYDVPSRVSIPGQGVHLISMSGNCHNTDDARCGWY